MTFLRDRTTWVAYVLIAWFAYLQAAPGLVIPHLRDELHLGYAVGGLHVAAFAAGSALGGLASSALERTLGRRAVLWAFAAVLAAGTVGLAAGRVAGVTVGSALVMGLGGGVVLTVVQAALADRHGEQRAVALAEANVAASVAYLVLIGGLSLAAAAHLGWRPALLVPVLVPVLLWLASRGLSFESAEPLPEPVDGRLPRAFWVAAGMLSCTTASEWCVTAWGATYVEGAADVTADTAVTLMGGYFVGVLVGRVAGSRLARRHEPARLLAVALATAGVGFAVLWPATVAVQAVVGLALLGVGLGNLFPLAISLAVALAPGLAALASGRAVAVSAVSVLLAPLAVGAVADAVSLRVAVLAVPLLLLASAVGLAVVGAQARRATAAA